MSEEIGCRFGIRYKSPGATGDFRLCGGYGSSRAGKPESWPSRTEAMRAAGHSLTPKDEPRIVTLRPKKKPRVVKRASWVGLSGGTGAIQRVELQPGLADAYDHNHRVRITVEELAE